MIIDFIDKRFIVEVIVVCLLTGGFAWNRQSIRDLNAKSTTYIAQQAEIKGKLNTVSALLEAKHKTYK